MDACKALGSLDDVPNVPEQDGEPDPEEVRQAQRIAGGLNWLATRTRPDIAFLVSQLASAATRCPERALALGKRCLRYLAGTRDHGVALTVDHTHHAGRRGQCGKLEAYGDASYEEGWSQTGVLVKLEGMTISWKSTKQSQVPRSTAESEVTAMAYTAQFLEGIEALYHSMSVPIETPVLYCDNRAAGHLLSGSNEWRTKALVNRVLGVKSLVELGQLKVEFKATAEMQAGLLTKFMAAGILRRQRQLLGCVPLHYLQ